MCESALGVVINKMLMVSYCFKDLATFVGECPMTIDFHSTLGGPPGIIIMHA